MAREFGALAAHPLFQLGDERRAPSTPDSEALAGGTSVDIALDVEQQINALDRFEGYRRDRRRGLPTPRVGCDVGKDEELASRMAPAERSGRRTGLASGEIEPVVAGIGVGLQDSGKLPQMPLRMIARSISGCVEQCCRW
jgi:hypothetical protein